MTRMMSQTDDREKLLREARALTIICPDTRCRAVPGQPCVNWLTGGSANPHPGRITMAAEGGTPRGFDYYDEPARGPL